MKNVLVYQVKIGSENIQSIRHKNPTDQYNVFEKKHCIPSVQRWAKKHGYDYKIYKESTIPDQYRCFFPVVCDLYSAEKMMRLGVHSYDWLLYIDADIYVRPEAGPFEFQKGLTIKSEIVEEKTYKRIFGEDFNEKYYYNAGVFSADRDTADSLYNYFIDTISSGDNSRVKEAEQDIINHWIKEHGCNELDEKWNFMCHQWERTWDQIIKEPQKYHFKNMNMYHFVSDAKRGPYREFMKLITNGV